MGYTLNEDLAQREAAEIQRKFDAENARGWLAVVSEFGIPATDANFRAVCVYCHPQPITVQAFSMMLQNPKSTQWLHGLVTNEKIAIRIILGLLKAHGRYSAPDLRVEATKLQTKSLEELRRRLAEVGERQRLTPLPVSEVKAQLANRRKLDAARENEIPPEITRSVILSGTSEFVKSLIRKYGAEKVNARLAGR